MSRRRPSRLLAGLGVAALAVVGCGAAFEDVAFPVDEVDFTTPLAIPPLAESRIDGDGRRVFELTAREGTTSFRDGVGTRTWGFNGDHLGPTLRAERGERVAVEVTNSLAEATTVHWHGMHLPAEMDGGPHQMVQPGESWHPTWTVHQPAATLWYHPHPHGETERHVYRGLAGLFLLDDPAVAPELPSRYGVDDIPVIVQDKEFDDDGQLTLERARTEPGLMGSTIMVNGTIGAWQEVTTDRVRLRILNGSTARTYNFGFDDDRPFQHVGTDGGLLRSPHETTRVRLSPGERAEMVVGLDPGETATLISDSPDLGQVAAPAAFGGTDTFDVLQLRAAPTLERIAPVPETLAEIPRLSESEAAGTREFEVAVRMINGRRMDPGRIDEVVTAGATEIWEVRSIDAFTHNFHVHDVQFQVLDIDGETPPPELQGWKDTVYLEPRRTYRLIMQFAAYTDPDSPYMFHCHLLRHEDEGLMGQFVVVEPGQEVGQPARGSGHGSHGE